MIPSRVACVRINEVVHKPANTEEVKGVDYVELYNNCDEAVNLAGWSLADEKENTFTLGQDSCEHIVEGKSRLVFFRKNGCSFEFGFGGNDKVSNMLISSPPSRRLILLGSNFTPLKKLKAAVDVRETLFVPAVPMMPVCCFQVTLRDATTSIVDQVAWGKDNANRGKSWSRIPDGTGEFQDGNPTAGGENVGA